MVQELKKKKKLALSELDFEAPALYFKFHFNLAIMWVRHTHLLKLMFRGCSAKFMYLKNTGYLKKYKYVYALKNILTSKQGKHLNNCETHLSVSGVKILMHM